MSNIITINKKRDLSIDVIKIFACFLVVLMHTLRHIDPSVALHPFIYYFTRCSMPLFFMASGAVVLSRNDISFAYCYKKIRDVFVVMLGYYAFDILFRIGDLSFSKQVVLEFISTIKSDFGVFWFLRALVVIYFLLPEIHRLYKKYTCKILLISGGGMCLD